MIPPEQLFNGWRETAGSAGHVLGAGIAIWQRDHGRAFRVMMALVG
jgi:hypothetical protein